MATGRENGALGGDGPMHGHEEHGLPAQIEQFEEMMERAREELDHYVERATGFIRERPLVAVGGAIAIGWLIGRLASRR